MIQKRYQYWSSEGIVWTPWFDYSKGGQSELNTLKQTESLQNKGLLNDFKCID